MVCELEARSRRISTTFLELSPQMKEFRASGCVTGMSACEPRSLFVLTFRVANIRPHEATIWIMRQPSSGIGVTLLKLSLET